ncbi:MAG TPA: isoprenylcysteine carboxylmethyltransferase family protein [Acidimicrobiales bacterium]|nr:isoprenylcysteine carboxylmethyltransferase family protein [Acidimicrobiales bacterium]
MTTLPYQEPVAEVLFWALLALFILGEYAMRFRSFVNRSGTRAERSSLVVVVVGVVGGLLGGIYGAEHRIATIGPGRWPLFVVGLILMAGGLFLRQWSIFVLGRYFTADVRIHEGQTVVDWGPYRWVRHPSYSGMVAFFGGLGLAFSSWFSLAVLIVVPTAGLVVRIRAEERALLAGLGEPYARFAAGRARLVPGVW